MNFDEFRRRADAVRDIPLEAVLTCRGAVRDRHDRARWHTERGPLSVTGAKFTNWHGGSGGGAIDLVMHLGYFWIGTSGSQNIILCESAIDAISYWQMNPQCICISTAGVRANPLWLPGLLARGYALHCGFDADEPGDAAASHMIALHPAVQRLRPPAHDWNDVLTSRR